MKVKLKKVTTEEALNIKKPKRKLPKKPNILFRTLIRVLSCTDLIATKFKYEKQRIKEAGKGPYFILMNHSSFIDLKIASKILYPMAHVIVCTSDGFIGKEWLMRQIGCTPTHKFIPDITLIKDISYVLNTLKTSVLMYPEAGYSFDGTATLMPKKLGLLCKKLGVPVMSIITDGAFLRQPLYNNLRLRKVKTKAIYKCILTKEELKTKSVEEIDAIIAKEFSFDNFKNQYENKVLITDKNRAEGLNRLLYRCPCCNAEGKTVGEKDYLLCTACGKKYFMDEYGRMNAEDGKTEFAHIPDWYSWERECVKKELLSDTYSMELDVDIIIMANYKALYAVGEGKLTHNLDGFKLLSADGKINYEYSALSSYSLNSDYYWYQLGDIICIGDQNRLYYCMPKQKDVVTKARLLAEELYKIKKAELSKA